MLTHDTGIILYMPIFSCKIHMHTCKQCILYLHLCMCNSTCVIQHAYFTCVIHMSNSAVVWQVGGCVGFLQCFSISFYHFVWWERKGARQRQKENDILSLMIFWALWYSEPYGRMSRWVELTVITFCKKLSRFYLDQANARSMRYVYIVYCILV